MLSKTSRSALAILLALFVVLGATPSHADHVICVTVYYRIMGSSPQYILNDECFVSSPWLAEDEEDSCSTYNSTSPPYPTVQACYKYAVSSPV